jgi:hypothetical protein
MNIIIEETLRVYYYKDKVDLKKVSDELEGFRVNLHFDPENNPCRVCPRIINGKSTNLVLFKNTGDRKKDLVTLNKILERFNIQGIEEL